jgi:hypothetical protein
VAEEKKFILISTVIYAHTRALHNLELLQFNKKINLRNNAKPTVNFHLNRQFCGYVSICDAWMDKPGHNKIQISHVQILLFGFVISQLSCRKI